jgi:hypothetical protein
MVSNSDLIEKIKKFQSNPKMHSFTCGICSEELIGKEVEGVVILACEQCDYTQKLYHSLIEAILFFSK